MGAAWREENRMRPLLFQTGGRGWVWTLSLSLILLFQVGSQGNSLFPLLSIFKALAAFSKKSKAVDCVGLWLPDRKAMKTFQTNVSAHSCPTMEKNLSSLSKWQQQITKIASSASTIPHSPLVEDCPSTGSPLGSHDDTSLPPEQHVLMSMSKIWWSCSIVYRLSDTDGHQRCYFHLLEKKRSFSHWKDFGNMIEMKTSSLSPHSNNKLKIFQPTLSWRRTTRASSATVRRVRRRVKRTSRHLRIEILSDVCSPVSISRIKGIRNLETVTRRWSMGVCSNILVYLNLHQTSIGKIMSWTCLW